METNDSQDFIASDRRCALTREEKPKAQMVRFVADDSGNIFPDVSARAPGRGVWISADAEILAQAIKTNVFARALKRQTKPQQELIEQTRVALWQKALGLLALAKRAGSLISGFDMVCEGLRNGAPAFVIEASDGSQDGRSKVLNLAKRHEKVQIIGCYCTDDLGKTLGRDNMVHLLMPKGQFAQNWALELNRLKGFMPLKPLEWNI